MAFVPGVRHLTRAKDLADRRYADALDVDDLARAAGLYGIDAGFRDPSGNRFRLTQLSEEFASA